MIIPRLCDNCQETYEADTKYLNRGQGRFCSRTCSGAYMGKLRSAAKTPNSECAYCTEPMFVTKKRARKSKSGLFFCSREHQALAFSDPTIPVVSGPRPRVSDLQRSNCSTPGCEVRTTKPLCRHCKIKAEKDELIARWLAGDNSASFYGGVSREPRRFVKEYLLETRGDRCESCGFDKKAPEGFSIIQMDHTDGNCHNNSLENLKLLCPNCHAMTPTYGSKNKGSGRAHRRKASGNDRT